MEFGTIRKDWKDERFQTFKQVKEKAARIMEEFTEEDFQHYFIIIFFISNNHLFHNNEKYEYVCINLKENLLQPHVVIVNKCSLKQIGMIYR